VYGWDEVEDERGDVKGKDESDGPFEDCSRVANFLERTNTEGYEISVNLCKQVEMWRWEDEPIAMLTSTKMKTSLIQNDCRSTLCWRYSNGLLE
jgi:hypothetical protein